MSESPSRPILIFDGNCGFCRYWINRWRHKTRERVDYETSQVAGESYPEVPAEQFEQSVVLVEPGRQISTGAEAVFRAYAYAPRGGWPLALYEKLPGFAPLTESVYRFIARHRLAFSRLTRWLWGKVPEPSSWNFTRSVFIRALGLVYLIAFVSLWTQLDGLIGSNGLMPAGPMVEHVENVANQRGVTPYSLAPTLGFWLKGDQGLHTQCMIGTVVSLLVMAGLLPGPLLLVLWIFYLSLTVAGQTFLGFQWENLLLETGLIAVFLCPWRLRLPNGPASQSPNRVLEFLRFGSDSFPCTVARLLLWWLLFRLMLQSGLVKLASNDDVWWELTALTHHYWTQPLATWTSYYVHDLPLWFQKLSVVATYIIEIALPFLIVFPRRIRMLAFWGFTLLMLMIAITGNYTYFNLLTFVLCLMLIDDQSWPQKWRHAATGKDREDGSSRNPTRAMAALALPAVMTPLILVLLAVNIAHISWHYVHRTTYSFIRIANLRMQKTIEIPRPKMTEHLQRRFQPFNTSRSVNSFGLFANMTETRPEIIIEGSQDLRDWKPYEFKWKPGRLDRRPGFVQPHQPRLDWQMWFAALGNYRGNPWLISLMNHMLRGTPEPLSLLAHNPFPDAPPRFVRATTYDYTFTSPTEKRETGNWWKRDNPRPYTPALTLQGDQLVAVSPNN